MGFLNIVISNILGYDALLFVVAAVNLFFFFRTKNLANHLKEGLNQNINRTLRKRNESKVITGFDEQELIYLVKYRDKTNKCYSIFTNIISIFPYLGILGTVFTLILVAGDSGFENMQQSFLMALTSTGWGVLFAILFKVFCEAPISPKIDQFNADVNREIDTFKKDEPVDMGA